MKKMVNLKGEERNKWRKFYTNISDNIKYLNYVEKHKFQLVFICMNSLIFELKKPLERFSFNKKTFPEWSFRPPMKST